MAAELGSTEDQARASPADGEPVDHARRAPAVTAPVNHHGEALPGGSARTRLHFVFLQGMPSPFFARIAQGLQARGHQVTPVSLCVGDTLYWPRDSTVPFRGTLLQWPAFIGTLMRTRRATDLVLLGEQRTYHFDAVAVAHALGVRVSVTDFGYLRPDWITLERDGMSGDSHFPRELAALRDWARDATAVELAPRFADSARSMAWGDLRYSFANLLFSWRYPYYERSDRRPHPLLYFPAIGLRLLLARRGAVKARHRIETLRARRARYFVFPLQLEHDFQIVAYSPFPNLSAAIRQVLSSFARHASEETRLVVKLHPWDPGLENWAAVVGREARVLGIADRVDFLDGGDLDALIEGAQGMVTVNSTAAVRALQLGCPVAALGEAIYLIPGLAHAGPLATFWQHAQVPDPADVALFIRALTASIQIRGVFFSEPGLTAAVEAAVARLSDGTVGVPLAPARAAEA